MTTPGGIQKRARVRTMRSAGPLVPHRPIAEDAQITNLEASFGEQVTARSRRGEVPIVLATRTAKDAIFSERAPAARSLLPGALVGGRFIVIQEIGRGSTGVVFEMRHNELGHRVAIKALHPHIVDNPNSMWRFKREAQLTASLKHPNIVSIFDISQQVDSIYFIVQEFLEGESLRRHLEKQGKLPIIDALDTLVPIMGALVAAHHKGIVHRDVKPENIFLARSGPGTVVPKLIDFGLAKIVSEKGDLETQLGAVLGTPSYMSPEQALGKKVTAQADVWSMGVVFFEALAGERPFYSDATSTTMERVRQGDPKPLSRLAPHLPRELADIVHRALGRSLARRFATMFDFLAAVVRYAQKIDPSFSARHVASIPRSLAANATPEDLEPAPLPGKRSLSRSQIRAASPEPSLASELDSDTATKASEREGADVLAERALDKNALALAVELAEKAIAEHPGSVPVEARMRLVQAIACRWLGQFVTAERHARTAYRTLPVGSARWFAAINTLLVVLASMGRSELVSEVAIGLLRAEANASAAAAGAQIRALSQATISVSQMGRDELANRTFAQAQTLARSLPYNEVGVRIWLDLAEAELALRAGDHVGFLSLVNLSVETFATRGDPRNACLYQAEVGSAYLQLGAYTLAEHNLRVAIAVGEPMQLGFLVAVRANLALALARLGRLRDATTTSREAIKDCAEQSYSASLPTCRMYYAEILRVNGQLVEAEAQASEAVTTSSLLPGINAAALATLANILLQGGLAEAALVHAIQAMSILQSRRTVEAGEALIRLAYVRALAATGQRSKARIHLALARTRLSLRAVLISDPRWQKTFLEEIPENREITALDL